jgi:hypothetical protein
METKERHVTLFAFKSTINNMGEEEARKENMNAKYSLIPDVSETGTIFLSRSLVFLKCKF